MEAEVEGKRWSESERRTWKEVEREEKDGKKKGEVVKGRWDGDTWKEFGGLLQPYQQDDDSLSLQLQTVLPAHQTLPSV